LSLACGLYSTNSGICEGHGGITPGKGSVPLEIPPNYVGVYGFFGPNRDRLFPFFPC
jgi:hypothetical protein